MIGLFLRRLHARRALANLALGCFMQGIIPNILQRMKSASNSTILAPVYQRPMDLVPAINSATGLMAELMGHQSSRHGYFVAVRYLSSQPFLPSFCYLIIYILPSIMISDWILSQEQVHRGFVSSQIPARDAPAQTSPTPINWLSSGSSHTIYCHPLVDLLARLPNPTVDLFPSALSLHFTSGVIFYVWSRIPFAPLYPEGNGIILR